MRGPMAAERPEEAQCLPPGSNVINLRYHGVKFLFVGQLRRSRSLPPGGRWAAARRVGRGTAICNEKYAVSINR